MDVKASDVFGNSRAGKSTTLKIRAGHESQTDTSMAIAETTQLLHVGWCLCARLARLLEMDGPFEDHQQIKLSATLFISRFIALTECNEYRLNNLVHRCEFEFHRVNCNQGQMKIQ
jgi:hypothetical protein